MTSVMSHRYVLLGLAILLVGGSLGLTAHHSWRLHSESYRAEVEQDIGAFFELPCDLGGVRGDTFSSRVFDQVSLWLPDRRDLVFSCDEAVWREVERDNIAVNELDLIRGTLVLGTDRWQQGDYRQVFESGLGHDFEDLDLTHVRMEDFTISFHRQNVAIRCADTSGDIDMSDPEDGVAHLVAHELNGQRISQGVAIDARFLPSRGVDVREFILTLPEVPLACIGVGGAVGRDTLAGRFAGQVEYRKAPEPAQAASISLSGELNDADLSELTERAPLGPYSGRFSMRVEWARFTGPVITHFRGSGRLTEFSLDPFAPLLGREHLSGEAAFDVDPVEVALGRVNRLRVDGSVTGVSLEEVLHLLGRGSATGTLAIRVNNLDVMGETIRAADIVVNVVPPSDGPGAIDRTLLLAMAEHVLDVSWPAAVPQDFLPDRLEYVEFGLRLLVHDNQLRILGTHGSGGKTILTIKLAGMPLGLVKEQSGAIDLGPHISQLLEQLRTYDSQGLRDWLSRQRPESEIRSPR